MIFGLFISFDVFSFSLQETLKITSKNSAFMKLDDFNIVLVLLNQLQKNLDLGEITLN